MPLFELEDENQVVPFRQRRGGADLYEREIEDMLWQNFEELTGESVFPIAKQADVAGGRGGVTVTRAGRFFVAGVPPVIAAILSEPLAPPWGNPPSAWHLNTGRRRSASRRSDGVRSCLVRRATRWRLGSREGSSGEIHDRRCSVGVAGPPSTRSVATRLGPAAGRTASGRGRRSGASGFLRRLHGVPGAARCPKLGKLTPIT
jgi:hypothetical protein